jgi:hypothetical protein
VIVDAGYTVKNRLPTSQIQLKRNAGIRRIEQTVERPPARLHSIGHGGLRQSILLHRSPDLIRENLLDRVLLARFQNPLLGQELVKRRANPSLLLRPKRAIAPSSGDDRGDLRTNTFALSALISGPAHPHRLLLPKKEPPAPSIHAPIPQIFP